jgi:hypothetical protein
MGACPWTRGPLWSDGGINLNTMFLVENKNERHLESADIVTRVGMRIIGHSMHNNNIVMHVYMP